MPVHEHKQKEKWDKKRKLKPLNLKRKKETVRQGTVRKMPRNRKRSAHAALCGGHDRTSPWWSWKVCDFDVTGSCDVISPDHFVRGFYYSSYRRCGLNFLVLQKDSKILVHNLSIHEKLEQSTHWNILKKWGKDFTFGSGCTVPRCSPSNSKIVVCVVCAAELSSISERQSILVPCLVTVNTISILSSDLDPPNSTEPIMCACTSNHTSDFFYCNAHWSLTSALYADISAALSLGHNSSYWTFPFSVSYLL